MEKDPVVDVLSEHLDMLVKERKKVAAMRVALLGLRGMAETEAAHGSAAWAKVIPLIDEALG